MKSAVSYSILPCSQQSPYDATSKTALRSSKGQRPKAAVDLDAGQKGFTLIELLIAVFILTMVVSTIYASYRGTLRLMDELEKDSKIYEAARTTMDRLQKDMGGISSYGGEFLFIGKKKDIPNRDFTEIAFLSAVHIPFDAQTPPGGIALIRYVLEEEETEEGSRSLMEDRRSYRIIRVDNLYNNLPLDQNPPRGGHLLCEGVQAFVVKFYDSSGKEYESWDSGAEVDVQKKSAPAVIAIQLDLLNRQDFDRPYRFSTSFHLPRNKPDRDAYPAS
ncbi:MAG: prepilin-type N-terminal cleavage/methylation domain-containing protein [Syntrophales bacterium]|nr:prepilin-type N-terminal cleavage/methylation domain-containing protein [Syntrophales bacterium]